MRSRDGRSGTRKRLIAAASELFAERGFHATTARDIARRAGVNLAAGHYHYGSKKDLYLEVLQAQFAQIWTTLARRGGSRPAAEIDRLGRRELAALLHTRLRVMLDMLIGPPPVLHGALMQREMTDPSEALPMIVERVHRPDDARDGAHRRPLGAAPAAARRRALRVQHHRSGRLLPLRHAGDFFIARGGSAIRAASPARSRRTSPRSRSAAWRWSLRLGRGRRMRAARAAVAVAVLASGCAGMWRPEGDGGWSPSRRTEELERLAGRAGVDLEGE